MVGRSSPYALYDERFVTFGEDDVYEQSDAAGFIRLFALPHRVRALKDQEMAAAANGSAASAKSAVTSKSGGAPAPDLDTSAEEARPKSPSLVLV